MNVRDFLPFFPSREALLPRTRTAVIALGGGGARGLAHLGALEAISQTRIQTERFVGVSIGALVGAMCAIEPDIRQVQTRIHEFLHTPEFIHHQQTLFGSTGVADQPPPTGLFAIYERAKHLYSAHRRLTRAVTQQSLLPGAILSASIEALIPDLDFSQLQIPLSIVAADLRSGHRVVIESGSLRQAIQASMALPGIFPPVEHNGMLLCDIGVVDSIPTSVANSYATDLTIAVDIGQNNARMQDFGTALEVMMRMQDIGEQILRREKTELADIHIRPELADVPWFDFRNPERIVDYGRSAAWEQLARHGFSLIDAPPADQSDSICG